MAAALLCLHSPSCSYHFLSSSSSYSSSRSPPIPSPSGAARRAAVGFAVFSSHSNPRILKPNRRSRHGRQISPYDAEDKDDENEEEESNEDDSMAFDDDDSDFEGWSSDRKFYSRQVNESSGVQKVQPKRLKTRFQEVGQSWRLLEAVNDKTLSNKVSSKEYQYSLTKSYKAGLEDKAEMKNETFTRCRFEKLAEDLDFDEKWFPLIEYLSTYGLKDSHFISIYERHMPSLQINLASAQERLEFLLSVGVKHRDIRRILVRQPQILEYTVENNLKIHVAFLAGIGVPSTRIGHIITSAPSLFSYSVEHSLKPTIRYLIEEVGIKGSDISKVVQLSPQILVQRIDNSWTSRFSFLSKELGASKDSIVKMVTKHPQLLHYSIEDGILPRINFLRSIGMRNSDILKVITSLTQVLSLSLERNLKPKYLYLINELRNEVHSLTKYPMYLSLSLEQRIRPRHRFLVFLKKAPKGPFPLSYFIPTDECFCKQWAGTSLEKYVAFRQSMQLQDLSNKYQTKR